MAKQTKKQTGTKPETEGEQPQGTEGETPDQENPNESSENEAPQEGDESSETQGEQPQGTELYREGDAAIVTRFCQGCKDGETVREDFPVGDIITGAWAKSAVQFGWARMLSAEEVEELNTGNKAED